jgi:hypothetical protein
MTVAARHNTPAARAAQRPQRSPVYSQDELRERRHKGYRIAALDGGWSLALEVAAICEPLAERIAAAPGPTAYRRYVDDITDAVHSLVSTAVGLLARADAQRKTKHLGVDERGRSVKALVDLTPRPKLPEVGDDAMAAGTWPATLIRLAAPYSDEMSGLLGRALSARVSERLVAALADVDRTALALTRRLDRDERAAEAARTDQSAPTPTPTDRARAELQALGVIP